MPSTGGRPSPSRPTCAPRPGTRCRGGGPSFTWPDGPPKLAGAAGGCSGRPRRSGSGAWAGDVSAGGCRRAPAARPPPAGYPRGTAEAAGGRSGSPSSAGLVRAHSAVAAARTDGIDAVPRAGWRGPGAASAAGRASCRRAATRGPARPGAGRPSTDDATRRARNGDGGPPTCGYPDHAKTSHAREARPRTWPHSRRADPSRAGGHDDCCTDT